MRSNIFDRLSSLSLFLIIILLPIFCLPFTSFPVETSKGLLLVLGLTLSIVFWAIARFIDGKISFPKSWLLVSGFSIAFIFLLSALFSSSSEVCSVRCLISEVSGLFLQALFCSLCPLLFFGLPSKRK